MAIIFFASFVIALLSGLGVGGGGLFVVFLNFFSDLSQLRVQGINLLFFLFSSGSAVCVHLRRRRIFGGAVLILMLFGTLGAILGMLLTGVIEDSLLRKIFGGMLVVTGMLSLSRNVKAKK